MDVGGHCAPRFAKLKDAFAKNFAVGNEIGASFAATLNGELVVDLWGGHRDAARTKPWQRDTIANVYSTTKGMTAICANRLVESGSLDLDAPVAQYWPEFAQAGKAAIPVRWLLSHRAGLAAIGLVFALVATSALPAHASGINLDRAKGQGLVGEKADGYVAIVAPQSNPLIQALVNNVNAKRRAAYAEIARKNATSVDAVARLAGEKLLARASSGAWVTDADGVWRKK